MDPNLSTACLGQSMATSDSLKHAERASVFAHARSLFEKDSAVAARLIALFIGLAGMKAGLLAVFRKHLYEIHWRVIAEPMTTLNHVAFFLFVGLGMLSLVLLGRRCQTAGIKTVRVANAVIIGVGLMFIFLTLHAGDKNYLYPVMTGVLEFKDLAPYLNLDVFFRLPMLAAWIAGYAVFYYTMARTGKERLTLYLTAAFAGAYGIIALRELAIYRNELLAADCFGLAGLFFAWRYSKPLQVGWLVLPILWTLLAFTLVGATSPAFKEFNPYLVSLTAATCAIFLAATLVARKGGFYPVWTHWLLFYFFGFFLLTNSNYPWAQNYNNLICIAVEVPQYFVGEVVLLLLTAISVAVYRRFRPQASLLWLDVLCVGLIALALLDLRLSQTIGVRLEWGVLKSGDSPKMMWRMAKPYLPGIGLVLSVLIFAYVGLVRGMSCWWRTRVDNQVDGMMKKGFGFVALCFVLLGVVGLANGKADKAGGQTVLRLASSSPVWKRSTTRVLSNEEFIQTTRELGITELGSARPVSPGRPRRELNVVFILMESAYNKHLSLFGGENDTQPLLSQYRDRMQVFPNFFSNFASSIHARFATFTGLYPVADFNVFTLERVEVKSLFEIMKDNGYSTSLFYSSHFDYTGFRDFLSGRGLDEMYDADTMPGVRTTEPVSWGLSERETLAAIRVQIEKQSALRKKFFLTYVPAAPHYPYDAVPEEFRKFKAAKYRDFTSFYLNELLYMDWVISSIIDELRKDGVLDRTLVIITSDHGEMLGDDGGPIGHGWAVTPELANVPLILMDPDNRGYQLRHTIGSQVDLLPTVLDLLGLAAPAGELYEGQSLYSQKPEGERRIYLNSMHEFAVVTGNEIVLGERGADGSHSGELIKGGFRIVNEGAKSSFVRNSERSEGNISISKFDAFQANLLRNYSAYRECFLSGLSPASISKPR